jgi:DNA-binding XRE family transcriptional regulator
MVKRRFLTLEMILSMCREDGDCLLWRYGTNGADFPYAQHGGKATNLRRLVCELSTGKEIPANHIVSTRCHHARCLNPEHVFSGLKSKIFKQKAKLGIYGRPDWVAKMTAARRANAPKLNMELAREIRQSTETQAELARKYGVNKKMIYEIKQGTCWAEAPNSVFFWKPAA